jgi:hypothetical protein
MMAVEAKIPAFIMQKSPPKKSEGTIFHEVQNLELSTLNFKLS